MVKDYVQWKTFGVLTRVADIMGIRVERVRMYFIYASFLTLGSPIVVYLVAAFWLNIRRYRRKKRPTFWDL